MARERFLSLLITMINFNLSRYRFDSSKRDIVFSLAQQISLSVLKFWHFVARRLWIRCWVLITFFCVRSCLGVMPDCPLENDRKNNWKLIKALREIFGLLGMKAEFLYVLFAFFDAACIRHWQKLHCITALLRHWVLERSVSFQLRIDSRKQT